MLNNNRLSYPLFIGVILIKMTLNHLCNQLIRYLDYYYLTDIYYIRHKWIIICQIIGFNFKFVTGFETKKEYTHYPGYLSLYLVKNKLVSQKRMVTRLTLWNTYDSEIKRSCDSSGFSVLQAAPWWVSGKSMDSVHRAAFGVSDRL